MKEAKDHSFSVVIPTRNREKLIKKIVKQLFEVDYPPHHYEVIVIDNASTDNTSSTLTNLAKKYHQLKIFKEFHLGPSHARNLGIKKARFQFIIFTDDDINIPKNFLKNYARAWSLHPSSTIIGGKIVAKTIGGKITIQQQKLINKHSACFGQLNWGSRERKLKLGEFLFSGNISINRNGINKKILLFNEFLGNALLPNYLIYAEDLELCYRCELLNKEVWYVPWIKVTNQVEPKRFSKKYIAHRYFLAGFENYALDTFLYPQFPNTYRSFLFQLKESLYYSIRHQNLHFFRYYCKDWYDILVIVHYFLHFLFVGDFRKKPI